MTLLGGRGRERHCGATRGSMHANKSPPSSADTAPTYPGQRSHASSPQARRREPVPRSTTHWSPRHRPKVLPQSLLSSTESLLASSRSPSARSLLTTNVRQILKKVLHSISCISCTVMYGSTPLQMAPRCGNTKAAKDGAMVQIFTNVEGRDKGEPLKVSYIVCAPLLCIS